MPFLSVEGDEFEEKTSTSHVSKVVLEDSGLWVDCRLRHVKSKELDHLFLDVNYDAEDWIFLADKDIIINAGGENIRSTANDGLSEAYIKNEGSDWAENRVSEYVYYELTQEDLLKICDANQVKMRINGERYIEVEAGKGAEFRTYCRQFYNNFYDQSKFNESQSVSVGAKPDSGPGCFAADTKIWTIAGQRPISSLTTGEWIWAYDEPSRDFVPVRVKRLLKHSAHSLTKLTFMGNSDDIFVTPLHRFLRGTEWVSAQNLSVGDRLVSLEGGGPAELEVLTISEASRIEPVYNLHTEGHHNFIANGAVAHNFVYFPELRSLINKYFFEQNNPVGQVRQYPHLSEA